jgi:hypothetical protein
LVAYANRAYLRRLVRWLVGAGIGQFLDLGPGIPTLGAVHEVARQAAPDSRVVYVDIDPVVVSLAESILSGDRLVRVVRGDLRHPQEILRHPDVTEPLDFARPVAVLMATVLDFVAEAEQPGEIITQFSHAVVAGSYLALSDTITTDTFATEQEHIRDLYLRTPTPLYTRTPAQIAGLLTGPDTALDRVEPGVVAVTDWHPDPDDAQHPPPPLLAAVAGRRVAGQPNSRRF